MPDIEGLSDSSRELYLACRLEQSTEENQNSRRAFYQEDLKKFSELNVDELRKAIQQLCDYALFIPLRQHGKVCFETRDEEVAVSVRGLDKTERMVFQVIEESHLDGVWIKKIKQKTGIQDNSVEKMVQRFMSMGIIQCVRHIKAPLQKTYMLSHLAPGDDVTGGSFYDQGDLDETMVKELGNVIILHVRQLSWIEVKRKRVKREHTSSTSGAQRDGKGGTASGDVRGNKRKLEALQPGDIEDITRPKRSAGPRRTAFDLEPESSHLQLAFPPGHSYPSVVDLRNYIDETGLLRTMGNHRITVEEVQQIVNVLVWDEKLEELNGGYRTVRGVREPPIHGFSDDEILEQDRQLKLGNGLTEMPCGRCPVIDLCGNGGPINAETCQQWESWIKML